MMVTLLSVLNRDKAYQGLADPEVGSSFRLRRTGLDKVCRDALALLWSQSLVLGVRGALSDRSQSKVRPMIASCHPSHLLAARPEQTGDLIRRCQSAPIPSDHRLDVLATPAGMMMVSAVLYDVPSLVHLVGGILRACAKPEMPPTRALDAVDDVDARLVITRARRGIARVADLHASRDRLSARQHIRELMSLGSAPVNRIPGMPVAIGIEGASPKPARATAVNVWREVGIARGDAILTGHHGTSTSLVQPRPSYPRFGAFLRPKYTRSLRIWSR